MISKREKLKKIRKSIGSQIKDSRMRQRLQTEIKRAEYIDELIDSKKHVQKQAEKKNVRNLKFQFFGEEFTTRKDLIYVTYEISEETKEKSSNVVAYLKKLMNSNGLSEFFDLSKIRVMNKTEEIGDTLKIGIFRNNHGFDSINSDPIDPVGTDPDDDEGGGGGF